MQIVKTINEMQSIRLQLRNKTIGFVPTMGFLHEGHLSLARKAKAENEIVVMSIFVNPLQFGPNEDFAEYPRDEARDISLAKTAGVDYLFIPTKEEIYPKCLSLSIEMIERANVLCGASRPGHFDGVVLVVTKLFHIVQPATAYFGLKDAQQVAVIDALITDLNIPIQLRALSTIREEDGLALSSRNKYLSAEERGQAIHIRKSLQLAITHYKEGKHDNEAIKKQIEEYLQNHCQAAIDYVQLWEYPTLQPVTRNSNQIVVAAAVKFAKARLIDNIIIDQHGHLLDEVEF